MMPTALLAVVILALMATGTADALTQYAPTDKGALIVELSTDPEVPVPGEVVLGINFVNPASEETQVHIDYAMVVTMGESTYGEVEYSHTAEGRVKIPVTLDDEGRYNVAVTASGIFFQPIEPQVATFALDIGGDPPTAVPDPAPGENGGGCLVATAAYGTELAPQIQRLREVRDNVVMDTESGRTFMAWFNTVYYAFSPAVADLERQSPHLRGAVALAISPMVATLGLLNGAAIDSEAEMLSYGIGIIALNLGAYAGAPLLAVFAARKIRACRV